MQSRSGCRWTWCVSGREKFVAHAGCYEKSSPSSPPYQNPPLLLGTRRPPWCCPSVPLGTDQLLVMLGERARYWVFITESPCHPRMGRFIRPPARNRGGESFHSAFPTSLGVPPRQDPVGGQAVPWWVRKRTRDVECRIRLRPRAPDSPSEWSVGKSCCFCWLRTIALEAASLEQC